MTARTSLVKRHHEGRAHLVVKEDVLRLQVPAKKCTVIFSSDELKRTDTDSEGKKVLFVYTPVNYVERVQISQRAGHLSDVEFCPWLWKRPLFLEVEEELEGECIHRFSKGTEKVG